MKQALGLAVVVAGLFIGVLALLDIGRRIGIRRRERGLESTGDAYVVADGAVFGLMGLIIAFTFSGAGARFDARRQLVGQEANAIGTAYLRLDLLPPGAQPELRQDFRNYVEARIAMYRDLRGPPPAAKDDQARAASFQRKIWTQAVSACREEESVAAQWLVISALNQMIDSSTTEAVARMTHPPGVIYWGLMVLVLAGALLAGYGMAESKRTSWIHMLAFSAMMAAAIYIILDLEYPRLGLIRIDAVDQ